MLKLLLTAALLLTILSSGVMFTDAQSELTWTFETIGGGIKPAIAVDSNDVPHVAWLTEADPGNTFYATNASGAWQTRIVSEGYFYGPLDITVSADGQPFIAYHDHDREEGVIATSVDGTWMLTVIEHPGHDFWDNAIVTDADGNWHTSGVDPSQFGSVDGVEYATNAYGGIRVEQLGTGPIVYEFATSIDIRDDGVIGVTYFNDRDLDLVYAERSAGEDGTWTLTTVESEGDTGYFSSFQFDAEGNPHISYFNRGAAFTGTIRYAWRDSAGEWHFEDVGELEDARLGMQDARKNSGIALDADGNPHIIYSDRGAIFYAIRGENGWTSSTVTTTDEADFGQLVEWALDSNGLPHLVYFLVTGRTGMLSGDIIYGTATEG
jgi:hypothetical protein